MEEIDVAQTDPVQIPQKAKFVIPIEVDQDIKSNPVFEIENNFQMRLMDLAKQLEKLAYYLEYENCDFIVYIIPKPLSISPDQITLLQKYSKSIPEGASIEEISESSKGELYVENLSLDTNSSTHHYGLIAIVIGVIALAAIRAFSKKKQQQNNPDQQPLNQQELQNLQIFHLKYLQLEFIKLIVIDYEFLQNYKQYLISSIILRLILLIYNVVGSLLKKGLNLIQNYFFKKK